MVSPFANYMRVMVSILIVTSCCQQRRINGETYADCAKQLPIRNPGYIFALRFWHKSEFSKVGWVGSVIQYTINNKK